MTEVLGQANNGVDEGSQLAYWSGAQKTDRIKYQGTTARYWWLRSPYPAIPGYVRGILNSGALNDGYGGAYGTNGIVPACCVI